MRVIRSVLLLLFLSCAYASKGQISNKTKNCTKIENNYNYFQDTTACARHGEGYVCSDGKCEQGYKVYTHSMVWFELYVCSYHYEYTDGSWSENYIETNEYPCSF